MTDISPSSKSNEPGHLRYPTRAFLITPLILLPLFLIITLLTTLPSIFNLLSEDGQNWQINIKRIVAYLFFESTVMVVLTCVILVIIVLPLFIVLRRFDNSELKAFAASTLIGMIIFVLLYTLFAPNVFNNSYDSWYSHGCLQIEKGVRTTCGWYHFGLNLAVLSIYGAISGLCFATLYTGQMPWNLRRR